MTIILDGSEAEVIGLEPGRAREVKVVSDDGKYSATAIVGTDDPQPRTIRLKPALPVSGALLDPSVDRPAGGE
jgi:hypothetical protein